VCERFVIPDPTEVEREFRVADAWWKFTACFNVAPGRPTPIVRLYEGRSEGVMLRWGLVPDWAEGDERKGCARQGRVEDLTHCPLLSGAWARGRRCILPVRGFYAWRLTAQRYRQPYYVRLAHRPVFGVAALWDRTVLEDDDDVIETCAIVTVPANALICELDAPRSRMPAILSRDDYEAWLGAPPAEAAALLRTCAPEAMLAHAVSPRVNSLKYDDPALTAPVTPYGEDVLAAPRWGQHAAA
jgi:putative SOS response-associated peptidase YedK